MKNVKFSETCPFNLALSIQLANKLWMATVKQGQRVTDRISWHDSIKPVRNGEDAALLKIIRL